MALDLSKLKIQPGTAGIIKTAPVLKTIRVKRPDNTAFFRIRAGPEWVADYPIFSAKGTDKEKYLVYPEFQQELIERNSLSIVRFYFGIEWGSNVMFLTDVGIQTNEDGTLNSYHRSRAELYEMGKEKWISISANLDLGAYVATEAKSKIPDPAWPPKPENIDEAVQIAFKNNVIDNENHPILKKLRGEI